MANTTERFVYGGNVATRKIALLATEKEKKYMYDDNDLNVGYELHNVNIRQLSYAQLNVGVLLCPTFISLIHA